MSLPTFRGTHCVRSPSASGLWLIHQRGLHASVKVHVSHDHSLLKAEWCASHSVLSHHVSSHLCLRVSQLCLTCVGFAWKHTVTQWMWTQCCMSTSALRECGMYECACGSISIIPPHAPRASVSDETRSQGTPHVPVCRIRQQQISDDREAQRK